MGYGYGATGEANASVSAEVPSPLPAQDVTDKIPYPASMEGNDGVIEKYTYGRYDGEQYFDLDGGVR